MNRSSPTTHSNQQLTRTAIVAALLVALGSCTDTPLPTKPSASIACPSGVRSNTGQCVMAANARPDIVGTSRSMASAVAATTTFTAFENPDATWTGLTTLIDLSSIPLFSSVSSVSDGILTVALSNAVSKRQAATPDGSGGWATWSCPPYAEVCSPHVLFNGTTSLGLSLSQPVAAFGFEIEPNPFSTESFTVTFEFMAGETMVGTITRAVDGNAGARLIAAQSSVAFDHVTISGTSDFAIGQLRYSTGDETETTEEVPAGEPATVTVEEGGEPVAGVDIPAGTFDEDVIVTVRLETVEEGGICHDFLLGQIGRCLEINATNKDDGTPATLNNPIIAGLCLDTPRPLEMYKFEDRTAPPRPLREVAAPFLNCEGFTLASAKPSNWLEGLAMGVTKRVGEWITPKSAYAADMGFGGFIDDLHLSFFTWATPIQVTNAGMAINVFNSGKDAFGVAGVFGLEAKGFEPDATDAGFDPLPLVGDAVTVRFGEFSQTIPPGSFRFVPRTGRWTFVSPAPVGINYMDIHPTTGEFRVAGRTPTEGGALPTDKPFTIRIGNRIRGGRLFCATSGLCELEH